jgi:single-strand DNA-binding protein
MNKVFLIGRLSRDPELRHTSSGMAVCQINVAISRRTGAGRDPETDFINVVVWDKQAENVAKYLAKGRQVAVEGRIQTRNYESNGQTRYVTEVLCDSVQFLETKNSAKNQQVEEQAEEKDDFAGKINNVGDDDLPW